MGDFQFQIRWQLAVEHHRAGRWMEAEAAYRQLILLDGTNSAYYANLGVLLASQGRFTDAAQFLNAALDRRKSPEVYNTLGSVLKDSGELHRAISAFRLALAMRSDFPEAHFNLGAALHRTGEVESALAAYHNAIQFRPGYASAHNNLGQLLCSNGKIEEGLAAFGQAIELQPGFAEAHNNLGGALTSLGRHAEALVHLRKAADLQPDSPEILNNLGSALRFLALMDDAIKVLRRAVAIRPGFAEGQSNLAGVLKDTGLIDESISCYRAALAARPDPRVGNGLLFALHHHPDTTASQLKLEHVAWDRQFAAVHQSQVTKHMNDRSPNRRLRVGYVGALDDSPVGRFMRPLIANHDREQFDVFCYADVGTSYQMAAKLEPVAVTWRNVFALSDEQLAGQVRADGVDILVDLAMHGGRNRLLAFARKPAPAQVTYLAYAGTTGMKSMDYRLSDPYLDPPPYGSGEAANGDGDGDDYSEATVRLPHTFWCYEAPDQLPAISQPPFESRGHITFGCLNSSAKINQSLLKAWRTILDALPNARIILHSHEGDHRRRVADLLIEQGRDRARVEFVPLIPLHEYFEVYNRIDIALDPFPFAGGTTTCDALWMGVPVVTLSGSTAVSRGGRSILSNLGLTDLIANNIDRYVSIAVQLVQDHTRLSTLRQEMRRRMQTSPLMDARGFTADVEAAFRMMWRKWCEGH